MEKGIKLFNGEKAQILIGVKMKRNPVQQYFKSPDNKAKLFLAINGVMILTTFLIVIGTILFILILVGIIHF